jgi:PAS domain S-box-containing protein
MSDDLMDLFLSTTEDYGVIFLDPDGRIRRWSNGAEKLFGYKADEVEGTPAHEIFVPPDRHAGVPEVELQTAREQGRAEDERWHLRKDGSRFWASGVMIALRKDGKLHGYAKVVRDFTDRRQLDEAMRQTQKLESVGVLAAGVAHDFNNVLTAILGNVSLVRRRLASMNVDGQVDTLLAAAERAGTRAADLVKQLLNYAGKGRREMRPIDIGQVMKDALAIVQASVSKKIKITRDIPKNSPSLEGDVGQIQQLILNLVLNGAEAIGDNHGEVSIRVRVRDVAEAEIAKRYAPFPMPPGAYTEIQVSDNGVGMDEHTLQQIFDPFFTTKFMGRGLGLAAALGIVRSHAGGIAVESRQGTGTTFTVLLPAEQETSSENILSLAEAITETARGEGLVLVVDDEVAIRSLIQHVLEDLGYTVVTAEHGAQALELFDNIPDEVKLVLLDVNMPVLDGGETALALRERKPDIPILVMSGIADEDALGRFETMRISGFIPKPFAPDQLAQAIAIAQQGTKGWAGKERRDGKRPTHVTPERRSIAAQPRTQESLRE